MYSLAPVAAAMDLLSSALVAISSALTPVVPAGAAGLSIVLLTVAVRLALVPVAVSQVRAEKVRKRIAPDLARISTRYRKDPQRMMTEQRKVYSEAGSSPFAGCLPGLVQIPIVLALYGVFVGASGADNALLSDTFGGVELGATLTATSQGAMVEPVFVLIIAFLAVIAWAQRRYVMVPTMRDNAAVSTGAATPQMPGIVTYLPYMTAVVAAFVPLAAGLYLLVSTGWALGERLILRRILPD
ncbi:membrane protein insertase YidC [Spiractinospora alimapuensis]|uniref:YidC/Oxa1 family membrane protein insertase n=1 Tax=Spiractinospora alimapuensis TaxID=2820884 RepID=UPI001F24ACAD|nr:YidC/Oxa1 family membrane protein insertase [Spiractinospora alimapuensis]QVQ50480.1 membrane protein insertase YidC [Spiractinospora alimapuensis]